MKRPNIILIYCDDLGYGDLGCYGSDAIKTPHLDRLAAEGVRFTNWYSNSPVCSPSRASLLTGLYPARAGVSHILGGKRGTAGLSPERQTLAKTLKAAGYRTALAGKWHLGASAEHGPNAHGFDEFYGFRAGCIDYYSHIFYWEQGSGVNPVHDLWHNETEIWDNGKYMTEWITDKSVAFIEAGTNGVGGRAGVEPGARVDADEPFFLYTAYNAPHYPMHAPQEYVDRFPDLSPDRRMMAAMIAAVDDGVGAIVETLKRRGIYEDTVIFFSSDNGPSTEARNWLDGTEDLYYGGSAGLFRGHKGSLFEGGIREPAIVSYPKASGLSGGRVCEEVCAMMDIVPTMLELAGMGKARQSSGEELAEADAAGHGAAEGSGAGREVDGANLYPMLSGTAAMFDRRLYWEYGDQLAVRDGKWKLVLNGKLDFSRTAADPVHLSDLERDPGERVNVADRYPDIAVRLGADVRRWYAALREEMSVSR
jgi:arylsulfatase A-like enzyme